MNSPLSEIFKSATPEANIFFVFGIIAFVIWMAYIVRLWFVQTSTFNIEKDVADIRNHLLGIEVLDKEGEPSVVANLKDYVSEDERRASTAQNIASLKSRRAFVGESFKWVALSIPILLIILVIMSLTS